MWSFRIAHAVVFYTFEACTFRRLAEITASERSFQFLCFTPLSRLLDTGLKHGSESPYFWQQNTAEAQHKVGISESPRNSLGIEIHYWGQYPALMLVLILLALVRHRTVFVMELRNCDLRPDS